MSLFNKKISKLKIICEKVKDKSLPSSSVLYYIKSCTKYLKETPRYACKASYTLEAAVILPLLACFFVILLSFFRIMQVQLEVQQVMDETSRKLAVYAAMEESEETKKYGAISMGLAKVLLVKGMEEQEHIADWVEGGCNGVSLLSSSVSGDEIDLVATYQVKMPVNLPMPYQFRIMQRSCSRKWTGWNGNADLQDTWVYITETGTVYHTTTSCTHLELSIRSVSYADVDSYRSSGGGKYGACPICAKPDKGYHRVYITNYGSCYHADLNCSGIKRTIYQVRLSEVDGKRACSKCGASGG